MLWIFCLVAAQEQIVEWGTRDVPESIREKEADVHHYYSLYATCPVCSEKFLAADLMVWSEYERDLDFKLAQGTADTCLFALWMCPKCNYCTWRGEFEEKVDAEKIRKALASPVAYKSYFEIPYSALLRNAERCFEALSRTDQDWAWLLLYGAWVARDSRKSDIEKQFHLKAQARFEKVAEQGEGNAKAAAAYLVGEIHRRYGNKEKAYEWLDKAEKIAKEVKSENIPGWIERCRKELEKK